MQGQTGYAELLYSITDNDQLFRDGALTPTSSFFSSMTKVVKVPRPHQPVAASDRSVLSRRKQSGGPARKALPILAGSS